MNSVSVVVGTPVYRQGAYILDRFLENQKEIQRRYPSSEIIFATNEYDFGDELETLLGSRGIRGKVLRYETAKPDYARSRIWNVACGREAIRRYILSQTEADYLLSLDADMTFDPDVIKIMKSEIQGCDVVYSGSTQRRSKGIALAGGGCCMVTRDILNEIDYRCLEFRNGFTLNEDTLLEFDLIRLGKKMKKGFFLAIDHFEDEYRATSIGPREVGLYRRITHSKLVRYLLIRTTMALQRDIGGWLNSFVYRLLYRAIPSL
ncbi:MAG TPA: glycosyltransferase family 2 protein [Dehalococcoidia bacterium]|nr:glycosyltransferase family 2 protein [Dehalococcoidia bacterium]